MLVVGGLGLLKVNYQPEGQRKRGKEGGEEAVISGACASVSVSLQSSGAQLPLGAPLRVSDAAAPAP